MSLETWLLKVKEIEDIKNLFLLQHPNKVITSETLVDMDPDMYIIKVEIDERKNTQENSDDYWL